MVHYFLIVFVFEFSTAESKTGSESKRLVGNSTQNGGENMAPKSLTIPLSMRVEEQESKYHS